MRLILAILLVLIATTGVASADELWVKNEGGLEITVHSDSNWEEVTIDGGWSLVGPGHAPADGVAKICSLTEAIGVDVPPEWIVIHADNISEFVIDVACNQSCEYITPEVRLVKDAPNPVTFDGVSDGGQSISDMNVEKDIAEYNSWFATQSWNELD